MRCIVVSKNKKKTDQNSRPSIRRVFSSTYIMYIILRRLIAFRLIKTRTFVSRPAILHWYRVILYMNKIYDIGTLYYLPDTLKCPLSLIRITDAREWGGVDEMKMFRYNTIRKKGMISNYKLFSSNNCSSRIVAYSTNY